MIVIDKQETLDSYLQLKPVKKWKRTKVSCFCNTCKKYKVQMLQSIILPFKCKDCKHSETMLNKYYPDFYLIDEQKIVEIKSDYLYNKMLKEHTKENEKLKLMKTLNVIILQSKELKEIGII